MAGLEETPLPSGYPRNADNLIREFERVLSPPEVQENLRSFERTISNFPGFMRRMIQAAAAQQQAEVNVTGLGVGTGKAVDKP